MFLMLLMLSMLLRVLRGRRRPASAPPLCTPPRSAPPPLCTPDRCATELQQSCNRAATEVQCYPALQQRCNAPGVLCNRGATELPQQQQRCKATPLCTPPPVVCTRAGAFVLQASTFVLVTQAKRQKANASPARTFVLVKQVRSY
jgi:hypothetical protein